MSGGSFDYLCSVYDLEALRQHREHLDSMAKALKEYPESKKAIGFTEEVQRLLEQIDKLEQEIMGKVEKIREVWKGVEWHHSGDSSSDDVVRELEKFNKQYRTHHFTIILKDKTDFDEADAEELFKAGCDDCTPGVCNCVVSIHFDRLGFSEQEAIDSAVKQIIAAGFEVGEIHRGDL